MRILVCGVLAVMLAAAAGVLSFPPAGADSGDPPPSDSAVTVSGHGEFADLKVTVSQTKNLINQTVTVSWTGAKPTVDATEFLINYLQIMQCWGDDPAGPDRSQCQFGGASGLAQNAGSWVPSRQVSYGPTLVDPNETLKLSASGQAYVPFWAVGQPQPTGSGTSNINEFFNSQVTNEIPLARTHGDGTGAEFFEIQTLRQAAGLGCGEPVSTGGSTTGRSCWLVIVPRGNKEVNGSTRTGESFNLALQSSPLSQSNWDNRIVVPLEFQPVGQACPIGAPERPLVGHELAADAVNSWQPVLCAGGGPLFSYTQLTDDIARSQVQDGRLTLVTDPVPPDQVPADLPLVYAPVGLSGLAVAFNVEHQLPSDAPPADLELNGRRFTSMKLTPRLVAKLLTQSYLQSMLIRPEEVKNNPEGLLFDPEFLDLNPEYQGFTFLGQPVPEALVQLNSADVTSLLWSWVKADPDASAFLTGTPDKFGMRVNPLNQGLALPTSIFPRNDQSCVDQSGGDPPVPFKQCTIDDHPYANDMHDAGRSASRGDSLARNVVVDATSHLPVSQKAPRQGLGHRALVAVVDAATAARYGLPTAQLLNAAGKFVAPTTEGLLAGEAAMKPSGVAGVLASDPAASDPAAYPLTALSYAVAAPSALDPGARKDYSAFLRYAGGPGQQPGLAIGELPFGMVPLPDPLKAQTIAAAITIETTSIETPTSPRSPLITSGGTTQALSGGSTTTAGTGGTATNSAAGRSAATNPGGGSVAAPAGVIGQGSGPSVKTPSPAQQPVASLRRTPSLVTPAVGALFATILICAALAAMSPPVMHLVRTSSPVAYLLGAAARRRARKGVTPAER